MALTKIVSKKSVSYTQSKLHTIIFNLVLKEGETEVLNKDISCQFHDGDSPATKVALVISLMQEEINHYKSAQVIFNNTVLDNAVTTISEGLIL